MRSRSPAVSPPRRRSTPPIAARAAGQVPRPGPGGAAGGRDEGPRPAGQDPTRHEGGPRAEAAARQGSTASSALEAGADGGGEPVRERDLRLADGGRGAASWTRPG